MNIRPLQRLCSVCLLLFMIIFHSTAQNTIPARIKKNNLYAGIDVGSKGVKLSIIEMKKNGAKTGEFRQIKDSSINTDFINFSPSTFSATLNALTALYNVALNGFEINPSKIFSVVSSGVKGQADKENKNEWIKNLDDSFRISINEPTKKIAVIDGMEEARLSHLGIIPEERRYNTFLIDIGSGNTKGGYFRNGNTKNLKLFLLSWGTKTITNATEKRLENNKSIANYNKQLSRVLAGEPEEEIIYAVNESGAYNMNDNFAFSGGIAWSVATLLYPELIEHSVVPFSYDELAKLSERLVFNYPSLSAENIARTISDKSINTNNLINEINRVHKVFDQKSLIAGTALLLKIVRQFEGTMEKKNFFLVKNGQVGWISAYVNQSLRQ